MQQNKKNKKDNSDTLRKNFEDKLPKNVRQIGNVSQNTKIYIEEFVLNYLKRLQKEKQAKESSFATVLIGEKHVAPKTNYYFIQGAVELNINVREASKAMPEAVRKQLERTIESYFGKENSALCQLGWGSNLQVENKIPSEYESFHRENFGSGNTLFLGFYEDGEEIFFINENGKLRKQEGYYVYFERNEGMKQYVEDNQPSECVEMEQLPKGKSEKYRNMIASYKEEIQHKKVVAFLYTASTFLVMVVIVLGVTLINHYDKLKDMQDVISSLSQTVLNSPAEEKGENTAVSNEAVLVSEETALVSEDGLINTMATSESVGNQSMQTQELTGKQPEINPELNEAAANEEIANEQQAEQTANEEITNEQQTEQTANEQTSNEHTASNASNNSGFSAQSNYEQFMAEEFRCYVVQEGDTLSGICRKLYGSQEYLDKICEYNHIDDTDAIKVGQKIWVP